MAKLQCSKEGKSSTPAGLARKIHGQASLASLPNHARSPRLLFFFIHPRFTIHSLRSRRSRLARFPAFRSRCCISLRHRIFFCPSFHLNLTQFHPLSQSILHRFLSREKRRFVQLWLQIFFISRLIVKTSIRQFRASSTLSSALKTISIIITIQYYLLLSLNIIYLIQCIYTYIFFNSSI